jgi:hypothetical protein
MRGCSSPRPQVLSVVLFNIILQRGEYYWSYLSSALEEASDISEKHIQRKIPLLRTV